MGLIAFYRANLIVSRRLITAFQIDDRNFTVLLGLLNFVRQITLRLFPAVKTPTPLSAFPEVAAKV
jgi:hypothetical protein